MSVNCFTKCPLLNKLKVLSLCSMIIGGGQAAVGVGACKGEGPGVGAPRAVGDVDACPEPDPGAWPGPSSPLPVGPLRTLTDDDRRRVFGRAGVQGPGAPRDSGCESGVHASDPRARLDFWACGTGKVRALPSAVLHPDPNVYASRSGLRGKGFTTRHPRNCNFWCHWCQGHSGTQASFMILKKTTKLADPPWKPRVPKGFKGLQQSYWCLTLHTKNYARTNLFFRGICL